MRPRTDPVDTNLVGETDAYGGGVWVVTFDNEGVLQGGDLTVAVGSGEPGGAVGAGFLGSGDVAFCEAVGGGGRVYAAHEGGEGGGEVGAIGGLDGDADGRWAIERAFQWLVLDSSGPYTYPALVSMLSFF